MTNHKCNEIIFVEDNFNILNHYKKFMDKHSYDNYKAFENGKFA